MGIDASMASPPIPASPTPPADLQAPSTPSRQATPAIFAPSTPTPAAPPTVIDPLVGGEQQPLLRLSRPPSSARILAGGVSARRGSRCPARRGAVRAPPRAVRRGVRHPSWRIHPRLSRPHPRRSAPVACRARTSVRGRSHAVHARLRLSAAARAAARASAHPRSFVHLLPPVGGSSSPIAACCHGSPPPRPLISLLLPLGLEQQRSVVYAAPRGQDSHVRATRGLICTGKQVLIAG